MRIQLCTIILICCATMLALADAHAQDPLQKKLTIELKDAPLREALDKVSKQSGVKFLYSDDVAKSTSKISASARDVTVGKWLSDALQNLPYSYQVVGDALVVRYDDAKSKALQLKLRRKAAPPVTGRITDSKGLPLPGATVRVRGTEVLSITDNDGRFSIQNASTEDVLVISFIGYKIREIKVADMDASGIIVLNEDPASLKEVIVSTGYQEVPLERATGSFSKVDNALLNRQTSTDIISRLKVAAPELLFDERGGTPRLSIRGRSTIYANDQPLIVVDNFPYDGDITNINPNDVESISILKDAAAASIWGVRAGNGVIVITTKKGRKNQPLQVELNSNVTIGNKPDLFYKPQISSSDFIDLEQQLFAKGFYNAAIANKTSYPVLTPVVELLAQQRAGVITAADATAKIDQLRGYDVRNDISKYFYRRSVNQQYALGMRGGSEKQTYHFSAGYDKNLNNTVGNGYDRLVLDAQQAFYPLKNLEINTALVYTQSNTQANNALTNIRMGTKGIYPYARLADDNGNPLPVARDYNAAFISSAPQKGLVDWRYIPVNELTATTNNTKLSDTRVSTILKYTVLKGLSASVNYQYERQNVNNTLLQGTDAYYTRNLINTLSSLNGDGTVNRVIPLGAIRIASATLLTSQSGRGHLGYTHEWNSSSLSAIAGFEAREAKVTTDQSYIYGFDPEVGQGQQVNTASYYKTYPTGGYMTIPTNLAVGGTLDRFRSYFANAAYTYNNRYTASISGRVDQSNLFGVRANQRSVPLWSAGLKWDINKEEFYHFDLLPLLNLRATYGYSGNYDNTVTAFTTAGYTTNFYSNQTAAFIISPPNTNLRWERSGMFNLAVDFGSKNSRITGSVEYYHKNGKDLIGYSPVDPTTGFAQYKGNVAGMAGSGWEVNLTTKNLTGRLSWETIWSFNVVRDKITTYDLKNNNGPAYLIDPSIHGDTYSYAPLVGRPLFGIYALKWAGLDPTTGDPRGYLNGKPSNDYGALLSVPVDSLQYFGRATPSVYGLIRNSFSYGPVSVSFSISYRFNYYFRRTSVDYSTLVNRNVLTGDYAARWQKTGDELKTDVPSFAYPVNQNRNLFYDWSAALIDKGDNIRLQDINLSYELPKELASRMHVHQLQLYGYLNNVGLIWRANKHHLDPDFPNMPLPRTIAFGVRAGF